MTFRAFLALGQPVGNPKILRAWNMGLVQPVSVAPVRRVYGSEETPGKGAQMSLSCLRL